MNLIFNFIFCNSLILFPLKFHLIYMLIFKWNEWEHTSESCLERTIIACCDVKSPWCNGKSSASKILNAGLSSLTSELIGSESLNGWKFFKLSEKKRKKSLWEVIEIMMNEKWTFSNYNSKIIWECAEKRKTKFPCKILEMNIWKWLKTIIAFHSVIIIRIKVSILSNQVSFSSKTI